MNVCFLFDEHHNFGQEPVKSTNFKLINENIFYNKYLFLFTSVIAVWKDWSS